MKGIIYKWKKKGVAGNPLPILQTFPRNRIAYIRIDKHDTSEFKIKTELPQKCVLSPVLFILPIDEFLKDCKSHFKFADDTSVLIEAETTESLNAQLINARRGIENWCSKLRMALNASAIELMLVNCPTTAIDVTTVKGYSCAITQQTKSLGLTIGDRLEYKEHPISHL